MKHTYNTIIKYIHQNVFCNIIKFIKTNNLCYLWCYFIEKKNFLLDINYFLKFQIYKYYVHKV